MALSDYSLAGKTALITGGGRGLGKAIAIAMAEAGADIMPVARTASEIEAVAAEARTLGRRALAIPCDVSQPDQVDAMARRALAELGRIDILVSNAGNLLFKPLVPLPGFSPQGLDALPEFKRPTTNEQWAETFNAHVGGAFHCLRALAPQMLERKQGRVIIIGSISAMHPGRFNSAYDAAKGALISLTRSLSAEWARYNVTVNCIAPGHFYTPMSAPMHDDPKGREWMLARIPMRRTGDPREVGALAVYLASDRASFLTGQTICIDGGETV